MIKLFKVMLVPNNNQRSRLFQFAGTARLAYNWALQKEKDAYSASEKFISNNDLRKEFTVLRNSAEYPWLKTISKAVVQNSRANVVVISVFIRTRTKSESHQHTSSLKQQLKAAWRINND